MSEFTRHMEAVARHLLGDKLNKGLSSKTELRFGTRGSLAVDLTKGVWSDHENATGGGVLDLIEREKGLANGAAVEWMRHELGIELAKPLPRSAKRRKKWGPIVERYLYADENDTPLFRVNRHEQPKDFSQERYDPTADRFVGGKGCMEGVRRVPHRLRELLDADPTKPVFICEGEKDANRLWSLGLVATTCPQGSKKWRLMDDTALTGRHVVLVPDLDDSGRDHGRQVVVALKGKAASVRVVRLPIPDPSKSCNDVSDWLDQCGGTAEELRRLAAEAPEAEAESEGAPEETEPEAGEPELLDPANPYANALRFLKERHADASSGLVLLRHHRGDFYKYTGTHWATVEEPALRSEAYAYLAGAFKPTTRRVNDFLDAARAAAHLGAGTSLPGWLPGGLGPHADELVPMQNGLLHLRRGKLLPHTPTFFSAHVLPFAYDPAASEPREWLKFLESVWPDDQEAIDCLQELIGYLISGDRRQQKAFLLVGPARSGKGTIARVIRAMIGAENVAGPTLSDLAHNFGLAPLIGKSVAIISDARLSGRSDAAVIAERLLSISGEDAITIDRKHREHWNGTLPTRFVVLTNELPKIADASGALASRFIVLTMARSFLGKEDHSLTDRLLGELPAIFNWAVAGWGRLSERGRFAMPASSAAAVEDIEALSSPILAFLKDSCTVQPGAQVECSELYERWCCWCEAQGRREPGTTQSFGRDLRAAVPGLKITHPRTGTSRARFYEGVGLKV
jgi:putative DNA primase/helicase